MKRVNVKFWIAAFCLCSAALSNKTMAQTVVTQGNCGTNLTYVLLSDSTFTIYGYGTMTDYGAGSAPWYSSYRNRIKTVSIGDSVTSIGDCAFYQCSNLVSVTIGNSVDSIGIYALGECSSLTSLTIPNSVTWIGDWAIVRCFSLTTLTIGNKVESIGEAAFRGCTSLTAVTIPRSVKSFKNYVFDGCSSLQTINFNAINCTTMGSLYAPVFYNCNAFTTLNIGDSVTRIPNYAFQNCTSLNTVNYNAINCTAMSSSSASHPFVGCTAFTTLNIGNSAVRIPNYAFYYCKNLTSATVGNNVKSIGYYAFGLCDSLKHITIGNSVDSIGNSAFYSCRGLTSVTIGDNVKTIGSYAFQNCSGLDSITIPESVTSIEYSAFQNCYNLKKVNFNAINCTTTSAIFSNDTAFTTLNIGNNVKSISNSIFTGCEKLLSVIIPNSVTSIGYNAFYNCSGLTSVSIGNSVTSIGNYVFYTCGKLDSVNIPNSVTNIGQYAFAYCKSLTSVTIPDSVTSIGNYAFAYCSNLQTVNYNAINCTAMAGGIFLQNTALTTLNIGNNVKSIPNNIFNGCSGLTSIMIPNSVISIGIETFANCSTLTSVTIGSSVTSIGNYAFRNSSSLNSITSKAIDAPLLGSYVFYNVPQNIPVYVPCQNHTSYATSWNYFTNFMTTIVDTTYYNATICYGSSYTDSNFTNLTQADDYYITLKNENDCDSVICLHLNVTMSPVQELCMISVDANNHNEVIWKELDEVVSYNIYREGTQIGNYDLVTNINYSQPNRWTDMSSDAKTRAYRYKVSAIDTCGNESELSNAHRTMHLTINAGQNNSWNLIWTAYEGAEYSTYKIYRAAGNKNSPLTLIGTMPAGNTSYSDFTAPNGNGYLYYMVEIVLDAPCVLTKSLSSIQSNIATNAPEGNDSTGIVETDNYPSLRVYPNPVNYELRITNYETGFGASQLKEGEVVEIYSVVGQLVQTSPNPSKGGELAPSLLERAGGEVTIDISHLAKGMYFLKIGNQITKFIKE